MAHTITIEIPDNVYVEITEQASVSHLPPKQITVEWLIGSYEKMLADPLIQLLGCVESPVPNIGELHDYYLEVATLEKSETDSSRS